MKVGDLIRVIKDNWVDASEYKVCQGQLALVVAVASPYGSRRQYKNTRIQMVSDGAVLWFLTKELEVVK